MSDYSDKIKAYINEEKRVLDMLPVEDVEKIMNLLEKARMEGRKVFTCGNGGSATTASHMGCDFNKGISLDKACKYDVECLSDNLPMMMAIANDISYDDIFVIPLQNKMQPGDIVVGISGSGNSINVVKAIEYANSKGGVTVSFTGYDGGKLKKISKYGIHIDVNNMQIVEDVHLILNHVMMYILSQEEC